MSLSRNNERKNEIAKHSLKHVVFESEWCEIIP